MNLLPVDVQTLGNHEFDVGGPYGAINYLKLLHTPTVLSNVDAIEEPGLRPFLQKFIIIEKNGLKIGVVGYVTTEYPTTENTGDLVFEDELEETSKVIIELRKQNVDLVVAVSHTGYEKDKVIAESLDADIIVGGHSHTLLYTGTPPLPGDKPQGLYPTVITQESGRQTLIVQASAYSKYLGYLKVQFEKKNGRMQVKSWEGNPILLDETVSTDPGIEAKLTPWRDEVNIIGSKEIGRTFVDFEKSLWACHIGPCMIGRLITDAMIYEYVQQREGRSWTKAGVAVLQCGGIRSSIMHGNISYADLWNILPFEDSYGMVELNGQHFKEMLEFSVQHENSPFLQMSGVKAKFDFTKPVGERVSDIFVRCSTCSVPTYEPLLTHKYYRIIMAAYMYNGGDGYDLIKKRARFWTPGNLDVEVFMNYIKTFSPLIFELDENVSVKLTPEYVQRMKRAKGFDLEVYP
ncbi:unnamed protein product [Bemisia tabaci]|uniref:5'-nucleotidase n=1 Tax=Bemisia tabaci TaxID=7038 RepID=A0A9P0F485_BEMTA|nr:unnamed protein product [Bemisia tabaci]